MKQSPSKHWVIVERLFWTSPLHPFEEHEWEFIRQKFDQLNPYCAPDEEISDKEISWIERLDKKYPEGF